MGDEQVSNLDYNSKSVLSGYSSSQLPKVINVSGQAALSLTWVRCCSAESSQGARDETSSRSVRVRDAARLGYLADGYLDTEVCCTNTTSPTIGFVTCQVTFRTLNERKLDDVHDRSCAQIKLRIPRVDREH